MSLSCANRKSRRDADEEVLEGAGGPRAVPVEVGGVGCGPAAGLAPEEGEDVEVQTARKVIWDAWEPGHFGEGMPFPTTPRM